MENNLREFYKKGARIELTISDIAEKDQCFGRLENGTGVLVRGVLAIGDTIEATINKVRPAYLEAIVDKVLTVSADRVEPVCPVFGVCGGCKWMHVGYDAQLRYKQKKVHDALVHIGGFQD
ncbi:MAG: TRAM domain-containing protein, partial [Chlorobium sp.]|nr:TRAM domain-containing protein [Chlorobium sp.]